MARRVIEWNRERLETLRAALRALAMGQTFTVDLPGHGKERFSRFDARRTVEYLDGLYAKEDADAARPDESD